MSGLEQLMEGLADALYGRLEGDERWQRLLGRAFDADEVSCAHLAVMQEPYLRFVLEGRKTVESRFSRRRVPPYGQVIAGDVLLLKDQAGPIVGLAEVRQANYYELSPDMWEFIRERFASALAAGDPDFWEERREARYAALIRVSGVRRIDPVRIEKRDRRGWVVLAPFSKSVSRGQLMLGNMGPHEVPEQQLSEAQTEALHDPVSAELQRELFPGV